ncbi:MAG: hypothetical protein WCZ65_06230 [Lysobacteraceae bacterium]
MSQYNFRVHVGTEIKTFTEVELGEYAGLVGLDKAAPGRYSWLFVMQLYLHAEVNGIDPSMIVGELKALEGGTSPAGTKPATEFTREPLKGLWHKHFFSAHFVGHNLANHHAGGRLGKLVEQVMDPKKYPVITAELINKLTHEIVTGAFEKREAQDKLTGEWIVFAKHGGQNYYLCLATHETGDQAIYDQIESACFRQFPALNPVV